MPSGAVLVQGLKEKLTAEAWTHMFAMGCPSGPVKVPLMRTPKGMVTFSPMTSADPTVTGAQGWLSPALKPPLA